MCVTRVDRVQNTTVNNVSIKFPKRHLKCQVHSKVECKCQDRQVYPPYNYLGYYYVLVSIWRECYIVQRVHLDIYDNFRCPRRRFWWSLGCVTLSAVGALQQSFMHTSSSESLSVSNLKFFNLFISCVSFRVLFRSALTVSSTLSFFYEDGHLLEAYIRTRIFVSSDLVFIFVLLRSFTFIILSTSCG